MFTIFLLLFFSCLSVSKYFLVEIESNPKQKKHQHHGSEDCKQIKIIVKNCWNMTSILIAVNLESFGTGSCKDINGRIRKVDPQIDFNWWSFKLLLELFVLF